jgi:hypothetical protein
MVQHWLAHGFGRRVCYGLHRTALALDYDRILSWGFVYFFLEKWDGKSLDLDIDLLHIQLVVSVYGTLLWLHPFSQETTNSLSLCRVNDAYLKT